MQFKILLAFFASVLLIGAASWQRLGAPKTEPTLISSSRNELASNPPETATGNLGSNSLVPTPPAVSNTEILSRNLLLEYVDLATNGQATDETVDKLAEKYVESIPAINKAETATLKDLEVVPDSKANFQNYADSVTSIYQAYSQEIIAAKIDRKSFANLSLELYKFLSVFSSAYSKAASKLKDLPVPASLASAHLDLINSYLSSATAAIAISKIDSDAAVAFAGLMVFNENLSKEDAILSEIGGILTSNGI